MSEMKCPCCGGELLINDGYDESQDFPFCDCQKCFFACNIDDIPRIAAAMKAEARHNALGEAVEWERECNDASEAIYDDDGAKYDGEVEFENILSAARAEVDRLIANEGAADCEGEG